MTTYEDLEKEARALRDEIDNSRGVGPDDLDKYEMQKQQAHQLERASQARRYARRVEELKSSAIWRATLKDLKMTAEEFAEKEMQDLNAAVREESNLWKQGVPIYAHRIAQRSQVGIYSPEQAKEAMQKNLEKLREGKLGSDDKLLKDFREATKGMIK